jgi:hypothetical protein
MQSNIKLYMEAVMWDTRTLYIPAYIPVYKVLPAYIRAGTSKYIAYQQFM